MDIMHNSYQTHFTGGIDQTLTGTYNINFTSSLLPQQVDKQKWNRSDQGPTADLIRLCFAEWPQEFLVPPANNFYSIGVFGKTKNKFYKEEVLAACNEIRQLLAIGANPDHRINIDGSEVIWPVIAILCQHFVTLDKLNANYEEEEPTYPMISYFIKQRNQALEKVLFEISTLPLEIIVCIQSMFIHPDAQLQLNSYERNILSMNKQDRLLFDFHPIKRSITDSLTTISLF